MLFCKIIVFSKNVQVFDDIFPVYFNFFLGLYIILTICLLLSFISFENVVLRMRKFPKKSDGFLGEICIFAEQIQ